MKRILCALIVCVSLLGGTALAQQKQVIDTGPVTVGQQTPNLSPPHTPAVDTDLVTAGRNCISGNVALLGQSSATSIDCDGSIDTPAISAGKVTDGGKTLCHSDGSNCYGSSGESASSPSANVLYCTYLSPGSDFGAKWDGCNAALVAAGGGTLDITGLASSSVTQTTSTFVHVGDPTGGTNAVPLTVLLPLSMTWKWSGLNDSTRSAITIYNRSTMLAQGVGGGGCKAIFDTGGSNTLDSLVGVDASIGQNVYTHQEWWCAFDDYVSTFTHGLVNASNMADEFLWRGVGSFNNFGNNWYISNNCCGGKFELIQGYGSGFPQQADHPSGGIPMQIAGNSSISIQGTANSPVDGSPNVAIFGTNRAVNLDLYMEGNGWGDTITPMVTIANDEEGVSFAPSTLAYQDCQASCTKPVFQAASTSTVNIDGGSGNGSVWILDTAAVGGTITVPSTGYGSQQHWTNRPQTQGGTANLSGGTQTVNFPHPFLQDATLHGQ